MKIVLNRINFRQVILRIVFDNVSKRLQFVSNLPVPKRLCIETTINLASETFLRHLESQELWEKLSFYVIHSVADLRRVVPGRSVAYANQALLGDWRVPVVTFFAAVVSSLAIQLIAKLRSLELYGLYDTKITTTSTGSSRQPHQFSSKLRKDSYVFSENRKSLGKGFQLVTMAVETAERGGRNFGLIQPTLIQQLKKILDEYPDDGQILKGGKFTVPEKIWVFQEQGSQGIAEKFARDCRKVRKGLPKLRWGSKKHSKESGSGFFARDSEVEREEL
ncbi:hypothetical protein P5673_019750 [Acropora cervicornis]|uniref:Uncharacterized protein n=1 Tax=Acropora cervicornis TaxID=6130 RepID=A0AAD9V1I2_ACRCE|nr:hypothetical protein P5673_019750 [Acropora cervicornis]